jgi:hypothetical protein
MKFSEIASRVTGFSTPIFGVSWTPPQLDRDVAERVILFLDDRRVLFVPFEAEMPEHCVQSVFDIRRFLTDVLGQGGLGEDLIGGLRSMRTACRRFITQTDRHHSGGQFSRNQPFGNWEFNQALGELRGAFGIHVAQIAMRYGVDVPEPLSSILPLDAGSSEDDNDGPNAGLGPRRRPRA